MDIDEEIKARVRAATVWDKDVKLEDFQIKAAENGYVLINLKTRRAQLIYDEFSELHDLEQLFPERYVKGRIIRLSQRLRSPESRSQAPSTAVHRGQRR